MKEKLFLVCSCCDKAIKPGDSIIVEDGQCGYKNIYHKSCEAVDKTEYDNISEEDIEKLSEDYGTSEFDYVDSLYDRYCDDETLSVEELRTLIDNERILDDESEDDIEEYLKYVETWLKEHDEGCYACFDEWCQYEGKIDATYNIVYGEGGNDVSQINFETFKDLVLNFDNYYESYPYVAAYVKGSHVLNSEINKPEINDIIDWLSEHDTAWDDFCSYFDYEDGESEPSDCDYDEVLEWIAEHDQLCEDFDTAFFNEDDLDI